MLRLCAAQLRVRIQKSAQKTAAFSLPDPILDAAATAVSKQSKPTNAPSVDADSIMTPPYSSPFASPRNDSAISPRSQSPTERRPLVWVDLGSGTGWNAERMDAHFNVKEFDRVFLVDLCPSLCNVARERVRNLGWTNVEVICDDASK
jgi:SAM-dependent methyltransferase